GLPPDAPAEVTEDCVCAWILERDESSFATCRETANQSLGRGSYQRCQGAAAAGRQYHELAHLTGGYAASICLEDWSEIFERLGAEVHRSSLACRLALPAVPEGETLDVDQVNVVYRHAGSPAPRTLGRAEAGCGVDGG